MHTITFNEWLDNRRKVNNCENTVVAKTANLQSIGMN